MPVVEIVKDPAQLSAVRSLMTLYLDWHRVRHAANRDLVDRYFDSRGFAAELAALPGAFARPRGLLLLATDNEEPVGTVAFRALVDDTCELKRLFVRPEAQGKGIGRALVMRAMAKAGAAGYRRILLDTGPKQHEAHALYLSLGFRRRGAYGQHDDQMRDWLLYFEREIGPSARPSASRRLLNSIPDME